jgi:hypothetical protein
MPPKQLQLHGFFRSTGIATPDTGAARVVDVNIRAAAREVVLEKLAETSGLDFVKNGSRDRYGHARTNFGGRPKKVRAAGDPTISSNRRQPGAIRRKEFSAQEKIQMIFLTKRIGARVRADNPEAEEEVLVRVVQRAVHRQFPTLRTSTQVQKLLAQEFKLSRIVLRNRLGQDLGNPHKSSRGSRQPNRHGNYRGAGFRAGGAGRKNKFEKFWSQVKIWHTCERLMGVRVDTQDIYLKFRDAVALEIKFLQFWHKDGKLPADQVVYLEELTNRLVLLDCQPRYRNVYVNRMMAWGSMNVGHPSRISSMTLAEEYVGWKLSQQSWDKAIHLAGLGTVQDLTGVVAVPEDFIKHRKDIALVFGDQVL